VSYEQIKQVILSSTKIKTLLLAVSKLQPEEKIRELYSQGQRAFAENYVQEALVKKQHLSDLKNIEWHFIGSLQSNKAKLVVGEFSWIHSVDSLSLMQKISSHCVQKNISQKILLQVNLADEASKGGFSEQELRNIFPELLALPHVCIGGLMTMPPLFENPELARPYFQKLRQLRDELRVSYPSLQELSMGTSSDYQVALEEGATMVRLGTVLFGERPHKKS
jgi:pyridoxal phosphate enzyme (YggS family)